MNTEIKEELKAEILDRINDGALNDNNIDDVHHICFNQDYFIIGYYNAKQWLKKHDFCVFEAIDIVRVYEENHFGKFTTSINSESVVNMLAYILGEEIISELDFDTIEELEQQLKK